MKKNTSLNLIIFCLFIILIVLVIISFNNQSLGNVETPDNTTTTVTTTSEVITNSEIPNYSGNKSIEINSNKPEFSDEEYTTTSFEKYSDLDSLGRCGVAYANIGVDLMPTEKRESISSVKPSGWHTVKYDIVSGKYLYNRCHLIGYQLTGENANNKNLITCTRTMNADTMLYYENMVSKYLKDNINNHVLYRVTPIYDGDNLVAKGVQMEASSVEDKCGQICYNVFIYNVEDGIEIDYSNGDSRLVE